MGIRKTIYVRDEKDWELICSKSRGLGLSVSRYLVNLAKGDNVSQRIIKNETKKVVYEKAEECETKPISSKADKLAMLRGKIRDVRSYSKDAQLGRKGK